MSRAAGMALGDALTVLRDHRVRTDVVVTSMGSSREWMAMGPLGPLDFIFVPSSMGQAPSLALGIALAQPARRVIACNGDGSMLMNLGSLASIAGAKPDNLVLIVLDNGVYEVTGAQPVPAAVDFSAIARGCGFGSVFRFGTIDEWRAGAGAAIGSPGPVFIALDVVPVAGAVGPRSPGPTVARAAAFRAALAESL